MKLFGFDIQEDMRKVAVERKGETNFFTSAHIKDCMKKVIAVTLHQTVQVLLSFFYLNCKAYSIHDFEGGFRN